MAKEKLTLDNTKYDKKTNDLAQQVMDLRHDRVKRWKKVHELLRKQNKKARKEQDQVAKDCQSVREEKLFSKKKSKTMGLRFGVSMPPMTYNALVQADLLVMGHSDLQSPEGEGEKGASNQVVYDLQKAFPQYRVS